jgi:ATP-binding cassette subfamily G (WHITE) protein 2
MDSDPEKERLVLSSDSGKAQSEISSNFLRNKCPAQLSWNKLEYTIKGFSKEIPILKSVSGHANSGEILAIIGESGSGKTTLVSLLSGRLSSSWNIEISGDIYINNTNVRNFEYSLLTSYLSQENIYFSYMTPREVLMFAGALKLKISTELIKKRVRKLLKLLQIENVADTIMGDMIFRGLSGGEKRRVCIALEIISNPFILMMDEPLSGLDSYNAEIVLRILRKMADKGKIIIITVHQPSDLLFSLFNRIILMQDGRFVYQGSRKDLPFYFASIGLFCPKSSNPTEYFIKLFHIEDRLKPTEKEQNLMKLLNENYAKSQPEFDNQSQDLKQLDQSFFREKASFWLQLFWTTKRAFKGFLRNPLALLFKVANTIVFGALVAMLFWDLDVDLQGVHNRSGLLRCGVINSLFFPIMVGAFVLPMERSIVHKEYRDKMYGIEAYLISKLIVELPMNIFFAVGLNSIAYYSADLNTTENDKFFIAILVLLVCQINGVVLGIISGGISTDVVMASFIGPLFSIPFLLFSGFFSNPDEIPDAFEWLKYTSPFYYGYQALLNNEFDGLDVDDSVYPNPYTLFQIRKDIGTYMVYFLINIAACLLIGYAIVKKKADDTTFN